MKDLDKILEEEFDEVLRFQEFKDDEKETKYTNQLNQLESKIVNLVANGQIVQYLQDFKYALIQHVLIIQETREKKMFRKGLEFGKLLAKNEKQK